MIHLIGIEGRVRALQYRQGKLIKDYQVRNRILWDGKVDLMERFFRGTASWTNFYVGLLKDPASLFMEAEPSLATLFGKEFATYDEAGRQQISFAAVDKASDGTYIFTQNPNTSYATFTVSTGVVNQVLQGIYIVEASTKAVQPTRCWCTAAFGNNDSDYTTNALTVNAGDTVRIQYTVRIPKA